MKKTFLFGILMWVIIFVEVSIIGFTPSLAAMGEHGFTLLPTGIAIHFVFVAILATVLAKLYFRKSKVTGQDTFITATIICATGLVLDAMITVPFFVKSYPIYFSKWTLWTGIAIFIGAFVGFGKIARKTT